MNEIPINTPIGEMTVSKEWLIKEITHPNTIKLVGNTVFITSGQHTFSMANNDYQKIKILVRDNKLNDILDI